MEKKGKIKKLDKTQIYFILKGIFVGLLTGIVVSLFRLSIEKLSDLVRSIYEMSREQPIYLIGLAICCILAAFFAGYLVKNEPDIKGSGIPQVRGTASRGIINELVLCFMEKVHWRCTFSWCGPFSR